MRLYECHLEYSPLRKEVYHVKAVNMSEAAMKALQMFFDEHRVSPLILRCSYLRELEEGEEKEEPTGRLQVFTDDDKLLVRDRDGTTLFLIRQRSGRKDPVVDIYVGEKKAGEAVTVRIRGYEPIKEIARFLWKVVNHG